MIVCIAEKPSVARDIASLLGARKRVIDKGAGYLEGNGYQVTWTFGHLCTLKEPHDYNASWRAWGLSSLPMIPERFGIKAIDNELYQRQLSVITSLMQTATMVINCGDAGQEGELIQRWVLQLCGCRVPVKRLWISSLTDEAIREGFQHLRDEADYQSLYEAGLARAIGDWLLGMNATRLYTMRYAQGRQLLSIGRVQTPTLALVVERQREIEQFVPETYWELRTLYREVSFAADKGRYDTPDKARQALEAITGLPFEVTDIKQKAGKELPPRLFDLTSLQVTCNRKFGMSAEETLQTIQSLYEKKLTSYPRVDTTYLSEDIYERSSKILLGLVGYRELTTPLLTAPSLRKSKKVFDNAKITDHHAIIPTGQPVHGLSDRESKVFDLVARHFIAAFYPDCQISTTTVQGKVGRTAFKTSGKEILQPGWRVVFSGASPDDEPTEGEGGEGSSTSSKALPQFVKGEEGPHTPELKERQTQPPKYYTEATLLRAMETAGKLVEDEDLREAMKEQGIGRPSTRANIIETLFKRGYIVKEKRSQIHATSVGRDLIDKIRSELLKSAELTGQWEYKLRQIERRELEASAFLGELKAMTHALVHDVLTASSAPGAVASAPPTGPQAEASKPPTSPQPTSASTSPLLCPKCGRGYIIRGRTSYGCSAYHEGCDYRLPFDTSPQAEV